MKETYRYLKLTEYEQNGFFDCGPNEIAWTNGTDNSAFLRFEALSLFIKGLKKSVN